MVESLDLEFYLQTFYFWLAVPWKLLHLVICLKRKQLSIAFFNEVYTVHIEIWMRKKLIEWIITKSADVAICCMWLCTLGECTTKRKKMQIWSGSKGEPLRENHFKNYQIQKMNVEYSQRRWMHNWNCNLMNVCLFIVSTKIYSESICKE